MAPKLIDVDQKKKEIIEATIYVLSEKGVKDIRVVDIAKNLNMGKSTIYEYFDNKAVLLKQSLEYFFQEFYISKADSDLTFIEGLESVFLSFSKHTEEELNYLSVLMDLFFAGIKGDLELNDVYEDYLNYMENKIRNDQKNGLIRKDINPEGLVAWVCATLDGLGVQVLIRNDINADEIYKSFIEALKKYLK